MEQQHDIDGRKSILEARNLTLMWENMPIVEDLSLALEPGEIACLVGKSGTGKSTIFHALAGLSMPAKGQVLLDGRDISGVPGHISYMLQKDLLLPNLSVVDNTALPLVLAGQSRESARAKAASYFETFGLSGSEDLWPAQLSGGMRQRAAFLRTYLMGSSVVLLDEPFSALDAITRAELRSWFLETAAQLELSVLLVTHDVDEALALGERVIVLTGAPMQGVPSRIAGEILVPQIDVGRMDPAVLDALKQEILSAL